MNRIEITNDREKMISIGKRICEEKASLYDNRMRKLILDDMSKYVPNISEAEKERFFYQSVYDYWVYGSSIKQFFFYGFYHKSHEEKNEYLTQRNRLPYIYYLNRKEDSYLLEDKYEAYTHLKQFYKREIIKITSESDYPLFRDFTSRHREFIVKPTGLVCGIGVHRVVLEKEDNLKEVFDGLLEIGRNAKKEYGHWTHVEIKSDVVVEEVLHENEELSVIHPYSLNILRIATVRTDNKVDFFYPRISIGNNKEFITNAATGSLIAGINKETGVVETNGFSEYCEEYETHPITKIKIKGYRIPYWNDMKTLLTEASKVLPTIRYVGWDVALTNDRGWAIIEGNYMGEFTGQVAYGKGAKREFEEMIGWKPEKEFWWE